jgi:hypothetical protein
MVLDVQEVGRAEVLVAIRHAGVDARGQDLHGDARAVRVGLVDLDRALDVLEAPPDSREHHVLDRELDRGVRGVDLPRGLVCHSKVSGKERVPRLEPKTAIVQRSNGSRPIPYAQSVSNTFQYTAAHEMIHVSRNGR